jgi:hypothetical protein
MLSKLMLSLLTVATVALLSAAAPTSAQARDIEDRMAALHYRCDRGDQRACVEFGRMLEANRERHEEWRDRHPEYWGGRPPVVGVPVPPPMTRHVVEVWGSPEHLIRLHHDCDRGIRPACREYREVLESRRDYHAEWRRTHPEFWQWRH